VKGGTNTLPERQPCAQTETETQLRLMLYLLVAAAWVVTFYVVWVALTKKRSLLMALSWLPILVCLTVLIYMNNSLPQTEATLAAELKVTVAQLWLVPFMVVMMVLGVLQEYKRRRSGKTTNRT